MVNDIKAKRFQFLQALYNESEQDEFKFCNGYEIGGSLGFDQKTIDKIIRYFAHANFVERKGPRGSIAITHSGICHVEMTHKKRAQFFRELLKSRAKKEDPHLIKAQVNKDAKTEREGLLEPKPPEILQKALWVLKYGRKYWKLILLVVIIILISSLFVLPKIELFSKNTPTNSENSRAIESHSIPKTENFDEIKKEAIESIRQQGREELEKLKKDTDAYKKTLQDQIIEKAKQEEISDDDALKLSEMVQKVYSSDLKVFLKEGYGTPDDIKYSLTECRAGIFSREISGGGRLGAKTSYRLTKHGKMLYEIINGKSL